MSYAIVRISFNNLPDKIISADDYKKLGGQKGYAKANKVFENQIIGIELIYDKKEIEKLK
jgi:hypothetical protein